MRTHALAVLGVVLGSTITAVAAPTLDVKDGTATIVVPRPLVANAPTVTLTIDMPPGWKQSATKSEDSILLVPESAKYDRPSITINVQIDNLDPAGVKKRLGEEIKQLKKVVVGGGKIKMLGTRERPDGAWLSRSIDAKKERDIQYVETVCLVSRPGQPFVVKLLGFAEQKDAALIPLYERTCASLKVLAP